jgi:hypothetical protein
MTVCHITFSLRMSRIGYHRTSLEGYGTRLLWSQIELFPALQGGHPISNGVILSFPIDIHPSSHHMHWVAIEEVG